MASNGRKDWGDWVFQRTVMVLSCVILVLAGAILFLLTQSSWLSIRQFGASFLWTSTWDPVFEKFGALPFIYGTLVSSFVALLLAVPIGVGTASSAKPLVGIGTPSDRNSRITKPGMPVFAGF